MGSTFLAAPALAQAVDAGTIVETLTPKKPLTRSFKAPSAADAADEQFLQSLPTRGLRIDQRKKLDEIVAKKELPKIDITINFDYDSDRIRPDSIPALTELGKALTSEALASSRIVLNGHTDAAGSEAYNQNLSDRRAASVRDYLIGTFNIGPDRLIAVGFGEERLKNPVDPLAAENRRVEVVNLTSG
ncbi:MAG: hypothetical protein BroJett030_30410 [Alphaproteobacteria bacterium]|nr:MAG: hypothetical protein BroJett030_30410 [Alphaproteobacteria bacterium]